MAETPDFRRQVERQRVLVKNDGNSDTFRDHDALVVLRSCTEQRQPSDDAECHNRTRGKQPAHRDYA